MEHVQHVQEMGKKHWLFDMQRKRNVKAERKKLLVSLKSVLLSCPHSNTGYKRTFHYISRIDGHFGIFFLFQYFMSFIRARPKLLTLHWRNVFSFIVLKLALWISATHFRYLFSFFSCCSFLCIFSVFFFDSVWMEFEEHLFWMSIDFQYQNQDENTGYLA